MLVSPGRPLAHIRLISPSSLRKPRPLEHDFTELRRQLGRVPIDHHVAALAPTGSSDAAVLEKRRTAASARLAETVASLEGIRLDLLRLHAGAGDLAPLTTLIEAAHLFGADVNRLANAQREVDAAVRRPIGPGRVPTPG